MFQQLRWRADSGRALFRSSTLVAIAVVILLAYQMLNLSSAGWTLISLLLVMQTQTQPAVRLAAIRVGANIAGASVAIAVLQAGGDTIPAIAVALLLVGMICHFARLDDGIRSAYVSVAIVMAADQVATLAPPLERIASVTVGSFIGVGGSWLVERIERWWDAK